MDCEVWEGGAMCGNFAKLQTKKPEPFDYGRTYFCTSVGPYQDPPTR